MALPVMGVMMALGFNACGTDRPVRVGVVDGDLRRFPSGLVQSLEQRGGFAVRNVDARDLDGLVSSGEL